MKARAPFYAKKKMIESAEWNEPILDGQKNHVRFIWLQQYGTGSNGQGATGKKNKPAKLLARMLADRPGVNLAEQKRQQANREAKKNFKIL